MDIAIDMAGTDGVGAMGLAAATGLANNVFLSLTVERGSFFFDPEFGSRLHLLRREKSTPRVERLAKSYAEEALAWLVSTGRAKSVSVEVSRPAAVAGRLALWVLVTPVVGSPTTFNHFVEVA